MAFENWWDPFVISISTIAAFWQRGRIAVKYAHVVAVALASASPAFSATYDVLWWDATSTWGGQAPDAFRQEMSDSLTAFNGGSVFSSTYVSSETPGTLATHLGSNSYDVIVFDVTPGGSTFNAADLTAVQAMYSGGKNNLLLDGSLYIRSINYNATTDYPGVNGSSAALTINEVFALARRGGGIMIGTDHNCCQSSANFMLGGLVPGAAFSGVSAPTTSGQWNGTELLNVAAPVAPLDIFTHWSSEGTQGIPPTGTFLDFLGNSVTLYSQIDTPSVSLISTSFRAQGGGVIIDDPDPPPQNGVPEPASWAMMIGGLALVGLTLRRRRTTVSFV